MNEEMVNKGTIPDITEMNKRLVEHASGNLVDSSDLKIEVNELVWRKLPASTTLEQAERIACKIYILLTSETL